MGQQVAALMIGIKTPDGRNVTRYIAPPGAPMEAYRAVIDEGLMADRPTLANEDEQSLILTYLRQVGQHPMLTPEEEHELAIEMRDLELRFWWGLLLFGAEAQVKQVVGERMAHTTKPVAELVEWTKGGPQPQDLPHLLRRHDGARLLPLKVLDLLRQQRTLSGLLAEAVRLQGQITRRRERFIHANLRLVMSFARSWRGAMPMLDLIQEGNIGLCRAVGTYDPEAGTKFSTYAGWWIKQYINRALKQTGKHVRLPIWLQESQSIYRQHETRLSRNLGRQPTQEEIMQATGWKAKRVLNVSRSFQMMQDVLSLDSQLADDKDDRTLHDLLEQQMDEEIPSPEEVIDQQRRDETVRRQVDRIRKPIVRDVIARRFGLVTGVEETLKEIGPTVHPKGKPLSRERVRQIQRDGVLALQDMDGWESLGLLP